MKHLGSLENTQEARVVLFIKLQNICVTVLYSYKKYCRIVRFSNVNGMMHGLNGLSISLMHNNFLITYLLLVFL